MDGTAPPVCRKGARRCLRRKPALARRFGSEGMNVVANYRTDEEGARETVRAIEEAGGAAAAVRSDVSKAECVDALFDAALFSFGGVDIWVNNAGVEAEATPSDEKRIDEWQRTVDVNLTGVFAGCRRALDHFLSRGMPGCIVNVSSVHELVPWPRFADYAASKAGVGMLTKTLALEYADRGIRVNAVAPGPIWTPLNPASYGLDSDKVKHFGESTPMGRPGQPYELAPAYVFLASDDSSYVSGQVIHVNGGTVVNG